MDRARWERVQALFHQATELPASERERFLTEATREDPSLAGEVLSLLAQEERGSVLDRGLEAVASEVLADASSEAPPTTFGPYRLKHVIGEGGMGVVYLAERADLGSTAAIKILRDAWLSPSRRERFAAEQRTLAQLRHPAIAHLHDAGTLPDGTPWFVMEYVEGVPLTRHCAARHLPLRERLLLLREVCEAVLHAHRHAVIHRDLKPSNILVTREGRVKLLDFGIAKPLAELASDADRTRTELRLMTPAYAAPEQIRGEQLGVHTDIYSLGVILYELLTGRLPVDAAGRKPDETWRAGAEWVPEKPSVVAARPVDPSHPGEAVAARPIDPPRPGGAVAASRAVWADLDVLCLTAMHADPMRRYRTVDSLIRDIDHHLRNEPIEARPDALSYRLGKFTRRHRRALSLVAVMLAVVVGLVTYYTVRLGSARNAAVEEAQRTRRIQDFMASLFEGNDEAAGPPDSLRVVSLLDSGLEEAHVLDGEPLVQAELYHTLGDIYHKLGRFERADSLFTRALEMRRARLPADHSDIARNLVALGLVRADEADLEGAEALVRDGLARTRKSEGHNVVAVARATTALGLVLVQRGTYDEATAVLTEAVRMSPHAAEPTKDLATTLTALANAHFYAGHYEEADSLNREVLAADRALYGERHPNVAADLLNLGAVQQERGRPEDAEAFYRQALEIYRAWYGEDHYETAATLTMIGRALIPQGRYDEASELLHQALATRERVFGPSDPNVASTLNEIGLIALKQGRLGEAEADFRRMADIYKAVYADKHYLIGVALANLGSVYLERRAYAEAEQLFREVIRRYTETLSADHVYVAITRIKLGRALLRQGRIADAERESLAGYERLSQEADPQAAWLKNARMDLAEIYGALGRPSEAARYREEAGAAETKS